MTQDDAIDDMITHALASGDAPPADAHDRAQALFRWRQPDASARLVLDGSPVGAARSAEVTALRWAAADLAITIVRDAQSGTFVGTVTPGEASVEIASVGDATAALDVSDLGMFTVPAASGDRHQSAGGRGQDGSGSSGKHCEQRPGRPASLDRRDPVRQRADPSSQCRRPLCSVEPIGGVLRATGHETSGGAQDSRRLGGWSAVGENVSGIRLSSGVETEWSGTSFAAPQVAAWRALGLTSGSAATMNTHGNPHIV